MSNSTHRILLSGPLSRQYNTVAVFEGDDPLLKFDLSDRAKYVNAGLSLTIYKESERTTIISKSIESESLTVEIPDFAFGNCRAVAVVEDRSETDKIVAKETIAYIYFKQFKGVDKDTPIGHVEYKHADGSVSTVPYYESGFLIT